MGLPLSKIVKNPNELNFNLLNFGNVSSLGIVIHMLFVSTFLYFDVQRLLTVKLLKKP